jgi:hypothetical protein
MPLGAPNCLLFPASLPSIFLSLIQLLLCAPTSSIFVSKCGLNHPVTQNTFHSFQLTVFQQIRFNDLLAFIKLFELVSCGAAQRKVPPTGK